MFGLDDLLDFGASIYSADSASQGQQAANETNLKIAELNNQTMIDLAANAHQREVADLLKAGLNPVLSVDGAGAPVPALTSARVENARQKNIGSGVHDAFSAKTQRDIQEQNEKLNEANIKVAEAQAKNLDVQNDKLKAEVDQAKAQTYKTYNEADFPGVAGSLLRTFDSAIGPTPRDRWLRREGAGTHDLGKVLIKARRSHSAKDLPYIGNLFK